MKLELGQPWPSTYTADLSGGFAVQKFIFLEVEQGMRIPSPSKNIDLFAACFFFSDHTHFCPLFSSDIDREVT